jgi:hypothetical protein
MIYLEEIPDAVEKAYFTLADIQYDISVLGPVSGDTYLFNDRYTISTKILAYLEYLNTQILNKDFKTNSRVEVMVTSLKELTSKAKLLWG